LHGRISSKLIHTKFNQMKKELFLLIVVAIFVGTNQSYSQSLRKGKIGLTASLQDNQFGVMLPVFISGKFSLAPALDVKIASGMGAEYTIGVMPKWYLKSGDFMPYLGFRVGTIMYFPNDDKDPTFDFVVGPAFGGEYFFNEHLSAGVEAQGNFTYSDESSDRFGNPGKMNFNFATMVFVSVFF